MKMKKMTLTILAVVLIMTSLLGLVACDGGVKTVKIIDIELSNEQYGFAVKKGNTDLKDKIDAVLVKNAVVIKELVEKLTSAEDIRAISNGVVSSVKDPAKAQLVVATSADFPPFEDYDGQSKFYGVDMEIAKIIADELKLELVIDNMDFTAVLTAVQEDKADVGMAGLTINAERMESVDFSAHYIDATQMLIVKTDDTRFDACKTADDVVAVLTGLKKKKACKVGVQSGTTGEQYVKGNEGFGFDGFANLKAYGYASGALAVQALINGSVSCVIIDKLPAMAIVKEYNK